MSNTYRSARRGRFGPLDWCEGFDPTRDGAAPNNAGPFVSYVKRSQRRTSRHRDALNLLQITRDPSRADSTPWDLHRLNPWAWD